MSSLKSILLALVTGAALMTTSIAVQASTSPARDSQDRVEAQRQPESQPEARKECKRYRWVRQGHPGKGPVRRVCVDKDKKERPRK